MSDGIKRGWAYALWRRLLGIRYEKGPWSLARVDKGARYGLKSLFHLRRPLAEADARHFAKMRAFLLSTPTGVTPATGIHTSAVGDVMWVPHGWDDAYEEGVEALLAASHLRFANLETPVDPASPVPRWTYASFNAPVSMLDGWRGRIGPTVFSLCNNHVLDRGVKGLCRTREELLLRGMTPVGGPAYEDACVVAEHDGRRIAVVALTYGINPWGPRGDRVPPVGVPVFNEGSSFRSIEKLMTMARSHAPDLIVVLPHWGYEFEYYPAAQQRRVARRLVELGADLIFGASPHVLQPVDVVSVNGRNDACPIQVQRPGPPRYALIAYSLGNFFTSMPSRACRTGGVLSVNIGKSATTPLDLRSIRFDATVSTRGPGKRVRRLPVEGSHDAHIDALVGPIRGRTRVFE